MSDIDNIQELKNQLLDNLNKISESTNPVSWKNYQAALNTMDDYIWIRISPKIHYAFPIAFATRENRGYSGAYEVYVNNHIPKKFQTPVEMHEWGHIIYSHLLLPKAQRKLLIDKIRSYWPEIKLHLSEEVLKNTEEDKIYGDYICDRLCNCILNIAQDFEVNSKLFPPEERDNLIDYLSISGGYSLACAPDVSESGLKRAIRWTEYRLGIRKPKPGKKPVPLFMPCLPEDMGLPSGLDYNRYIDYMIIHDDEFFQYAKNQLGTAFEMPSSNNSQTPQSQELDESDFDEMDENMQKPDISNQSDYGSKNPSGSQSQNNGLGQQQPQNGQPSLPELATEKQKEDEFGEDGSGMEDWNPSNDKKHQQNYMNQQQQNQQGNGQNGQQQNQSQNNNGQGSSQNQDGTGNGNPNEQNSEQGNGQSSSQGNGNESDSKGTDSSKGTGTDQDKQSPENQMGKGGSSSDGADNGDESSDESKSLKEGTESSEDGKDGNSGSCGAEDNNDSSSDKEDTKGYGSGDNEEGEDHSESDEMDSNGKATASDTGADNLEKMKESSEQDNKGGNGKGNNGDNKLTTEDINRMIEAYDDSDNEINKERIEDAEAAENNSKGQYSPIGGKGGIPSRKEVDNDIISVNQTGKLDDFIIKCCFNKQHMDTRVDSMYYYNRRKFNSNRIITKKRTEDRYKPGNIYILVDVSGSVSDDSIATIINSVKKVSKRCGRKSRIIWWDTELCGDSSIFKISHYNRVTGGTNISEGIKYIREKYLTHSNDKLVIVSDFCDSLWHWYEEIKQLKGDAIGICWTEDASNFKARDISTVKEYIEYCSYNAEDVTIIDSLLKKMPTILVNISDTK